MLKFRCQAARHSDTLLRRFRKIKSGEAKSKREVNSLDLRSCLILFWLWASGNNMATGRQTASTHGRLCPRHLNSEFYVLCHLQTGRLAPRQFSFINLLFPLSFLPTTPSRNERIALQRAGAHEEKTCVTISDFRLATAQASLQQQQQQQHLAYVCVFYTYIHIREADFAPTTLFLACSRARIALYSLFLPLQGASTSLNWNYCSAAILCTPVFRLRSAWLIELRCWITFSV